MKQYKRNRKHEKLITALKKAAMAIGGMTLAVSMYVNVFAQGTVTASMDKSSCQVNDVVTFAINTSTPEDDSIPPYLTLTYDAGQMEMVNCDVGYGGGGGMITLSGTVANVQFKMLKEGEAKLDVEAVIDDDGNAPATTSASVQVGGGAAAQAPAAGGSSNATLRSLSVSPGSLEPAFSPDVTQYNIQVDASVTDLVLSGGVADENAQITAASGFKNLKEGMNQAVITVTAQDGTSLTYYLNIMRGGDPAAESENPEDAVMENPEDSVPAEGENAQEQPQEATANDLSFEVSGITYEVQTNFDSSLLPKNCVQQNIPCKGITLMGATLNGTQKNLVYATDQSGQGQFFFYDDKKKEFKPFIQITIGNNEYVVPLEATGDIPKGFKKSELKMDTTTLDAYQLSNKTTQYAQAFYLFYGVDTLGESGFYLYDAQLGSCQRFLAHNSEVKASGGENSEKTNMIIGMMAVVMVGMLLLIANLIIRNKEIANDKEIAREFKSQTSAKKQPAKKRQPAKKPAPRRDDEVRRRPQQSETDDEDADMIMATERPRRSATKAAQSAKTAGGQRSTARRGEGTQRSARPAAKAGAKRPSQRPQEDTGVSEVKRMQRRPLQRDELDDELEQLDFILSRTQNTPLVIDTTRPGQEAKSPIFTLESKPVSLTREAAKEELDDDFEFEFLNLDE